MSTSVPRFHPIATGPSAQVVQNHQDPADIVLWGGWFCPFTQRCWIVLEEKGICYQYKEVNPYLKEKSFLSKWSFQPSTVKAISDTVYLGISPKGLTPGMQVKGMPLHDSTVINEFLEEAFGDSLPKLLPDDPYDRAVSRLWIDHINKSVVPSFVRLLQTQTTESQKLAAAAQELKAALEAISKERKGRYFLGDDFSLVDIAIAPWAVRDFIIRDFRGFRREDVEGGWIEWAEALEARPSVRDTTSVSVACIF